MERKVSLSHKTIIFTFLFMGFLWILYQIRGILFLLFLAAVLMTILRPAVVFLEKKKVPRGLAILLVYFLLLTTIGIAIALIVSPLAVQTSNLISQLPSILDKLPTFNFDLNGFNFLSSEVIKVPQQIFRFISSAASNLFYLFTLLVMTYYLLLERENSTRHLLVLFGDGRKRAEEIINKIEDILGHWARGQMALMVIVALMSYVGLTLLSIPSAVPLSLLAGLLEFVPNIGPMVATVPAAIVGFSISPLMGVATIILYWLIQQVENNILVPKIMRRAVGLNPLVSMVLLLSGFKVAGIGGAVLVIPFFLITTILIKEIYQARREAKN